MRGISEERLLAIRESLHCQNLTTRNAYELALITELINLQCVELNPWQPIETAPKDRRILLFYNGIKTVGMWGQKYKCWLDEVNFCVEPTHWQELPEDPK